MTTSDEQSASDALLASPPASGAVQGDDGPPIFTGSVSGWLGLKTFAAGALFELMGLAGAIYGAMNQQSGWGTPLLVGGVALALAAGLMSAYTVVCLRCQRYKITRKLIEREQGLLVKKVDALDLARVKDIQLKQTLGDRMLNIGTIEVFSSDKTDPVMFIEAIPNPRPVYEKLRDAVIEISRKRGVVPLS